MGINVISCAIMGITDQLFHEDRDGFVIFQWEIHYRGNL